ncbi:MAG: hypothetical protein LE180_04235, partial [Endomicrobium sp.]|uniref:hypothetical protein n=1 Tax=Candidatus Endomicrobiellum pyrsonymphae TaxID=1408203 RepID=UPI003575BA60|nr:hypothetical protein [Endomicrobium sp.]
TTAPMSPSYSSSPAVVTKMNTMETSVPSLQERDVKVKEMERKRLPKKVIDKMLNTEKAQVAEVVKEVMSEWKLPSEITSMRLEAINGSSPKLKEAVTAHVKAIRHEVVMRARLAVRKGVMKLPVMAWPEKKKALSKMGVVKEVVEAVVAMDARTVEETLITEAWAMMNKFRFPAVESSSSSSSSSSTLDSIFGPIINYF